MGSNEKIPRILSPEEWGRFVDQFNRRYRTPRRDRLMCSLMYQVGLRVGEVVALRCEHVRWEGKPELIVRKDKGAKDRKLTLPPELRSRMAEWAGEEDVSGPDLLFTTSTGVTVAPNHLRRRVRRVARDAGLREAHRVTPHVLRHSFATDWIRAGGTLEGLHRTLGHSDLSTTRRYIHLADDEVQEEIAAIHAARDNGRTTR